MRDRAEDPVCALTCWGIKDWDAAAERRDASLKGGTLEMLQGSASRPQSLVVLRHVRAFSLVRVVQARLVLRLALGQGF